MHVSRLTTCRGWTRMKSLGRYMTARALHHHTTGMRLTACGTSAQGLCRDLVTSRFSILRQPRKSHPLTHSLAHSLTHSITHSRSHTLTHSCTSPHLTLPQLTSPLSLTHSLTHSLAHSFTHAISCTHSITHSPARSSVHTTSRPQEQSQAHLQSLRLHEETLKVAQACMLTPAYNPTRAQIFFSRGKCAHTSQWLHTQAIDQPISMQAQISK